MATLQEIRDFVRVSIDVDDEELPNANLDRYIREGFNRIARAERDWSFYEVEQDFTVTADDPTYDLTAVGTYYITNVLDVRGPTRTLRHRGHSEQRRRYRLDTINTSTPYEWSRTNTTLYLWPPPNTTETYSLRGTRAPIDWIALGAGAEPDCPDEFHEVIAFWALSRAYVQQDEIPSAEYYRETFGDAFRVLRKAYRGIDTAGPTIYNELDSYQGGVEPLLLPYNE